MYKKDNKIKIYVSMHDDFYIADNKYLQAIQVGTSLADRVFPDMLHDNEGENISYKNKMYCELTAQYWVWKNVKDLDYYGFFHYRRYFSFNPVQLKHWENIVYFDYCDEKAQKEIMLDEDVMNNLISSYDVIYPQENPIGGDTVYEHWQKHLVQSDIDLLVDIIMEKYPEFYEVTSQVLNSKQAIHCNMFIMKKQLFNEYSEWLFDILEEHEKRNDHSNYSTEKYRTMGHLAERLCAIYGKYLEKKGAKICYLQRTLFRNTEKNVQIEAKNEPDRVPIVLACNNGYTRITSVLTESILKNSSPSKKYDIYLLHVDITKENMKILKDQVSGYPNCTITFINVKRRLAEYDNLFVDRHLSVETYFRFFAMDIFPNMDKILYLDCDTVVCSDVAELFETDLEGRSIGAVPDADIISLYPVENPTDPEVHGNIDNNIGLKSYTDYFQAGVLIFNLGKIRKNHTVKELFETAMSRKWKFQDQDVLNSIFKGDVKYINIEWNTLYECFNRMERIKLYAPHNIYAAYLKAKSAPKLIHYAGTPKPWHRMDADMGEYFWKYAKTSPFFEILIHEMNIASFNDMRSARIADMENTIENNNGEIQRLKGDVSWRDGEIQRLNGDVSWRDGEIQRINDEKNDVSYHLDEIRKSFTYKLARFITFIPRKLKGDK